MNIEDLDILLPIAPAEQTVKPRWGTVTQALPLRVRLDGDDAALPMTPASLVPDGTAKVGNRVWCVLNGRQLVVVGVWGGVSNELVTRVQLTSNFDTGGDVWTVIPWGAAVLNDAGAWVSAAPTIVSTPAGCSRAKATLYTAWTGVAEPVGRFSQIQKNNTLVVLSNRIQLFQSAESITTGWLPTTPGDTWRGLANSHGSGADLLGPAVWAGPCWMEVVFR